MALIPYLHGGERTTAARMNTLFEALDAKVAAAMDSKSLLFLAGDRLPQVKQLLGAKYFFMSGSPTYSLLYGGSAANNYNHAAFSTYAAGLTILETDDTYQIAKSEYVAHPPALNGSLEAHQRDGRWILESTGPEKSLADTISETQNLAFDFVSPGDGDPVNYWPEKTYRDAQAEIIIEGPVALVFPANYDKFNLFRFNNLGQYDCDISFTDEDDVEVFSLTVTARQSKCLRRRSVSSGYIEGGKYFQKFLHGDFRCYSRTQASRDLDGLGHKQKAPHESASVNVISNPAILWDFMDMFASGTPRFYLDHTEACDQGSNFDGHFPALVSGVLNNAAKIADAIIHAGKLSLANADGGGLTKTSDEIDYTGIENAIADFAGQGFTATVGDNDVTVTAGAPLQDFFPRTTNLFSYQQPYGSITAAGAPVVHQFTSPNHFLHCPVALVETETAGAVSFISHKLERYLPLTDKTLRQCVDTLTNLLTLEHGNWGRDSSLATEDAFVDPPQGPLDPGVTVDPANIPADQDTAYQTFTDRLVRLTPFGLCISFKSTLLSGSVIPDDYLFGLPTDENPDPPLALNYTIPDGDYFSVESSQLVNTHAVRFGPPFFPAFPATRELSLGLDESRIYADAAAVSFGDESDKCNTSFLKTHFNPGGKDYERNLSDKQRTSIKIAATVSGRYSSVFYDPDTFLVPLDFEIFPVADWLRAFHSGAAILVTDLQPITEGSDDFPPVEELFRHQPILSVETYNALAQAVNMIAKVSVLSFAQLVHKYPEVLGDPVVSAMDDVVYVGLDAISYRFLFLPPDQTSCFAGLRPAVMYSAKGDAPEESVWNALGVPILTSADLPAGYAAGINTAAAYATFTGHGEGFITAQVDRVDNLDGNYRDTYTWDIALTENAPGSSGLLNIDSDPINVLALSSWRGEIYDGTEVVGVDFLSTFEWISSGSVLTAAAGLGFAFDHVQFVQRGRLEVYEGIVTGSTSLGTWEGTAEELVPYAQAQRTVGSSVGNATAYFTPFTRQAEPFLSKGVGNIKVSYSMAYNDSDDPAHGGLSGCTPIARTNFIGFVDDPAGDWVCFYSPNYVTESESINHCLRIDTSLTPDPGETDELSQVGACVLDTPFNVTDSAGPPGFIAGDYTIGLDLEFLESNSVVETIEANIIAFRAHAQLSGVEDHNQLVGYSSNWFEHLADGCNRVADFSVGDLVRYYLFKDTRVDV